MPGAQNLAAGGAGAAGDDAGHDLVADSKRFAGEVSLDVFAHLDDGAASFVTEDGRAETEGVAFVFVTVGTADAAAFDFDQHFVVTDGGNGVFLQLHFAGSNKHGHTGFFGNVHFFSPLFV